MAPNRNRHDWICPNLDEVSSTSREIETVCAVCAVQLQWKMVVDSLSPSIKFFLLLASIECRAGCVRAESWRSRDKVDSFLAASSIDHSRRLHSCRLPSTDEMYDSTSCTGSRRWNSTICPDGKSFQSHTCRIRAPWSTVATLWNFRLCRANSCKNRTNAMCLAAG